MQLKLQQKTCSYFDSPLIQHQCYLSYIIILTNKQLSVIKIEQTIKKQSIPGKGIIKFAFNPAGYLGVYYSNWSLEVRKISHLSQCIFKVNQQSASKNSNYPRLKWKETQLFLIYSHKIVSYNLPDGKKQEYEDVVTSYQNQKLIDMQFSNFIPSEKIVTIQLKNKLMFNFLPTPITQVQMPNITQILHLKDPLAYDRSCIREYLVVLTDNKTLKIFNYINLKQIYEISFKIGKKQTITFSTNLNNNFLLLTFKDSKGKIYKNLLFKINEEYYYSATSNYFDDNEPFFNWQWQLPVNETIALFPCQDQPSYKIDIVLINFVGFTNAGEVKLYSYSTGINCSDEPLPNSSFKNSQWIQKRQWRDLITSYMQLSSDIYFQNKNKRSQLTKEQDSSQFLQLSKMVKKFDEKWSLEQKTEPNVQFDYFTDIMKNYILQQQINIPDLGLQKQIKSKPKAKKQKKKQSEPQIDEETLRMYEEEQQKIKKLVEQIQIKKQDQRIKQQQKRAKTKVKLLSWDERFEQQEDNNYYILSTTSKSASKQNQPFDQNIKRKYIEQLKRNFEKIFGIKFDENTSKQFYEEFQSAINEDYKNGLKYFPIAPQALVQETANQYNSQINNEQIVVKPQEKSQNQIKDYKNKTASQSILKENDQQNVIEQLSKEKILIQQYQLPGINDQEIAQTDKLQFKQLQLAISRGLKPLQSSLNRLQQSLSRIETVHLNTLNRCQELLESNQKEQNSLDLTIKGYCKQMVGQVSEKILYTFSNYTRKLQQLDKKSLNQTKETCDIVKKYVDQQIQHRTQIFDTSRLSIENHLSRIRKKMISEQFYQENIDYEEEEESEQEMINKLLSGNTSLFPKK